MKRIVTTVAVLGVAVLFAWNAAAAAEPAAKAATEPAAKAAAEPAAKPAAKAAAKKTAKPAPPTDRVVVMYFHRTQRCPTCRKMGGYSEEAVKTGFAKQIKKGKVEFHSIDFQDEKNDYLTKGYKITGPTLIVAKIAANKVVKINNLEEMWTKAGDKDEFVAYVQSNVKELLK
jgi:hypothetical protein